MWERFSERTRQVIFFAQEAAARRNQNNVATEHLLQGLLRDEDSGAVLLLERSGVDLKAIWEEVDRRMPSGNDLQGKEMQLAGPAKRAIDLAYEEAQSFNSEEIEPEHLLLGLLREPEGIAGRVLRGLGLEASTVRRLLTDGPSASTG